MNKEELIGKLLEKSAVSPIYVSEISRVYPLGSSEFDYVANSLDANDVEIVDDTRELDAEFSDLSEEVDATKIDLTNLPFRGDLVELFLRDIAPYPVLSQEEELELFKIYEQGVLAEERLGLDAAGIEKLLDGEREKLLRISQEADLARDRIINCNLRLVVYNAKGYNNRGLSFMDLIQEGSMGLMVAINKFDYTRGYKFSTYATSWIRQSISRALDTSSRTIRIPSHVIEKNNKIIEATRSLSQELGRDPSDEEIGDKVGLTADKVRSIKFAFMKPASLESKAGLNDDSTLGDFVKDSQGLNPYEYTKGENLKDTIVRVFGVLNEREASIMVYRYGLNGEKPLTLEEVGQKLGLTRERIRQIESRALKKLREPRILEILKDFKANE